MSNSATLTAGGLRRGQQLTVENPRHGVTVVRELMLALGPGSRLRGLLGRPPLQAGQGLLLRPCRQVHTFFMKYPIDVVFLDRTGQIVAMAARLAPWRVSRYEAGACCVLELAPGQAVAPAVSVGQQLVFRPKV